MRNAARFLRYAVVCALAILPARVSGQARHEKGFCLRGHPTCSSFAIVEIERTFHVAKMGPSFGDPPKTPYYRPPGHDEGFNVDLGLMVNRLDGTARGVSVQIGGQGNEVSRIALRARKRYWLAPAHVGLDVSAGVVELNPENRLRPFAPRAAYGVTTEAALSLGDYIGLTTGVDVVQGRRMQAQWFVGVRTESYLTLGLVGLAALLLAGYHDGS